MELEEALRKLPVEGYVWLNIRATNTPENVAIHTAFKDFCKQECDDNYTIGLKVLLGGFSLDGSVPELVSKVKELEEKVSVLQKEVTDMKKRRNDDEDDGTF
jgi:hypothetical protein